jgi:hypothetical protein
MIPWKWHKLGAIKRPLISNNCRISETLGYHVIPAQVAICNQEGFMATKITSEDFEFYTFFLGLQQRELQYLKKLLQSFPYYDTHAINLIDQSVAVKRELESGGEKFYVDWRSYKSSPVRDLNEDDLSRLLDEYSGRVNRIVEPERLFHGQAIDKVINNYASNTYVIAMDSDIAFTSDRYLPDMVQLSNRYRVEDLAAIGLLYQQAPFHLTLSAEAPPKFYHAFLTSRKLSKGRVTNRNNQILWKSVLKTAIKNLIKKPSNVRRQGYVGRFPRLHPALLVVNRILFSRHNMSFHHLYLDVLDIKDKHESKHRIFGDNGASFLYQCALAGKQIISIDFDEYATHRANVSVYKVPSGEVWCHSKEF